MRKLIPVLMLILLLAACGGDSGDANTNGDGLPEAGPLLEEAAAKVQKADSFGLTIDVEGYPVLIGVDGMGGIADFELSVKYADGVFESPDKLHADVEIGVGDLATTAELIAIDHDHYLKIALVTGGRWINQEIVEDFTPAALQSEDAGIAQALTSITELNMEGKKDLDGLEVYHLTGRVEAQKVNSLTFGLIKTHEGELDIEVYILPDERQIEQVILHEPAPAGAEIEDDEDMTTWTITFTSFNQPVTITAPTEDE